MKNQSNQDVRINGAMTMKSAFAAVVITLLSVVMMSCAKKQELKSTVSPDLYFEKATLDGKTFHWVRGVEDADSLNRIGAIPGFSRDLGMVKVRITENEVQFISVFDPARREATNSIVASFRVLEHFDIERERNDFGEVTNKVVEKKERAWDKRTYMRVDWSAPSNSMSELGALEGDGPLKAENVSVVEAPKFDSNGTMSWLTEFSAVPSSMGMSGEPSRIKVRTFLMPVVPSDYEKLNYREKDFQRFGYFYTQQNFEDPEKGLRDSKLQENTFANLRNVCEPGRKDSSGRPLSCSTNRIVWHLTKGFPAKYLEVTRRAVAEWNDTFKSALKRSDDVVVLDESLAVDIIDPRYNTIAHYEPKSPGGLLGVAQWVSNPITGELVSTRATVYEDGIRGTLGWVDDIITMILAEPDAKKVFLATDAERAERVGKLLSETRALKATGVKVNIGVNRKRQATRSRNFAARLSRMDSGTASLADSLGDSLALDSNALRRNLIDLVTEPAEKSMGRKRALMKNAPELYAVSDLAALGGNLASFDQIFSRPGSASTGSAADLDHDGRSAAKSYSLPEIGGLQHLHEFGPAMRDERVRMLSQAEKGIHGQELVEEAALRYILSILEKSPSLKDFKSQVQAVKDEVDRMTFYTTLLHEMGHTFGLRHNFKASADVKHYHPKYKEIQDRLTKGDKSVTEADYQPYMFSSIMDYGGDFFSQVGGLGSYDRAAIEYAYNRSTDRDNSPLVKENYMFCTDHQADESILCRRFDRGRNATEITANLIERYQLNWVLSHFRRDRADFNRIARAYPMNAMRRYFIPIRQVMDEFLYSIITAQSVEAKKGQCDMKHWRDSIEAGEIVNVCNQLEAEQGGVDPNNLASFSQGLFKMVPGPGGRPQIVLRKEDPGTYIPYGLADLVMANKIAIDFFAEVLGSTEPGRFVYILPGEGEPPLLERISPKGTVKEALQEFVGENESKLQFMIEALKAKDADDLVAKLAQVTGEIKAGRFGKPFNSEPDETTTFLRQKNIGAFWDKYVAMAALGLKDIGVMKYRQRSMSSNGYILPQTKEFTTELFRAVITEKARISMATIETEKGELRGLVEPTFNKDTQAIATLTALTDFYSDNDSSIGARLKVCSINDRGCEVPFGQKSVEFTSASGQERYRAAQTTDGSSIAFDLLTAAAAIDKERQGLVTKVKEIPNNQADAIMKSTDAAEKRKELETLFASADVLKANGRGAKLNALIISEDPKDQSAWSAAKTLAENVDKMGLFTAINIATFADNRFQQGLGEMQKFVQETDPKGECGMAGLDEIGKFEGATSEPKSPVTSLDEVDRAIRTPERLKSLFLGGLQTGRTALAGNGSGANGGNAAANKRCEAVALARQPIVPIVNQILSFSKDVNGFMGPAVDTKVAPLLLKRKTDELSRAESNIRFLRKVSREVGLE